MGRDDMRRAVGRRRNRQGMHLRGMRSGQRLGCHLQSVGQLVCLHIHVVGRRLGGVLVLGVVVVNVHHVVVMILLTLVVVLRRIRR